MQQPLTYGVLDHQQLHTLNRFLFFWLFTRVLQRVTLGQPQAATSMQKLKKIVEEDLKNAM